MQNHFSMRDILPNIRRYYCNVCDLPADDEVTYGDSCYIACSKCQVKHWYESSGDTRRIWEEYDLYEKLAQQDKYEMYADV